MTHAEKLNEIFVALREEGRCTTKKEFATLLGVNYTTIICAMAGNEKYSSDKLVAKAKQVLNNQLASPSPAPAPEPPRKIEELSPAEMLRIIGGQADTIRSQQEVIARLIGGVETKKGAV